MLDLGYVLIFVPVSEEEHLPKTARKAVSPFDNLHVVVHHGVITDLVTAPQLGLLRVELTDRVEVGF
jgi:hypothetical protein